MLSVMDAMVVYGILQTLAFPVADFFYRNGRRPDDDGIVTFLEAALWWKHGNGQDLDVDISNIRLDGITISDFNGQTDETFNTLLPEYWSGLTTGLVYGNLDLSIVNGNTVQETEGYDDYDFDMKAGTSVRMMCRNVEAVGGLVLHGPGKPFRININGTTNLAW